jgi:hypothetical protein
MHAKEGEGEERESERRCNHGQQVVIDSKNPQM